MQSGPTLAQCHFYSSLQTNDLQAYTQLHLKNYCFLQTADKCLGLTRFLYVHACKTHACSSNK